MDQLSYIFGMVYSRSAACPTIRLLSILILSDTIRTYLSITQDIPGRRQRIGLSGTGLVSFTRVASS